MKLQTYAKCHNAVCHNAECCNSECSCPYKTVSFDPLSMHSFLNMVLWVQKTDNIIVSFVVNVEVLNFIREMLAQKS